jgi:hypothetical protein
MGNDPLAVERNRDADWENLTWTRGRTKSQHTDHGKIGQPVLCDVRRERAFGHQC